MQSSSEQVIRRLYQITQQYDNGLEQQIKDLLVMGLQRFKLDIGILSMIQGDKYCIRYCVAPADIPVNPGDCFELQNTYCTITHQADGPVAIEHMGQHEDYRTHPAYSAFQLESYIGVPIRVKGKVYGTLNFSSHTPYQRNFEDTDIDALQLMASWIEVELLRHQQQEELNQLNAQLSRQANYDVLTNILNRRGMYEHLHKQLNQLCRHHSHATLAVVDIDHFKRLNDCYGHQTGDEVLSKVAEVISGSIRDFDLVARYGGEEFVLFLPNSDKTTAQATGKRIMANLAEIQLTERPITVSIGACYFSLEIDQPVNISKLADHLISLADSILYQAKKSGRNQMLIEHIHVNHGPFIRPEIKTPRQNTRYT